jgi:hypothetical protein
MAGLAALAGDFALLRRIHRREAPLGTTASAWCHFNLLVLSGGGATRNPNSGSQS